ncbi:MAG: response regulator transcription factor [Flavipsychrobacter sp.]|nr:response regulator transcription factor [Flavipsychrobacter sp.]
MKKIILAEDDPGVQDSVKLILERAGYEVTVMINGDPLISNEYELPDLFILDKQLSGINGLDICKHLKKQEQTKDIPVIMLSADPNIRKLAGTACADDALEKPFSMHVLRDMVAKYVG